MNTFKKICKLLKWIGISLAALVILAAGLVSACRLTVRSADTHLLYQGALKTAADYDYIVVPGAGLLLSRPGDQLQDRLDTAVTLYQNGAAKKIIVSGGYDKNSMLYESTVMRIYLEEKGIPKADILCDDYGIDTAETIRRVKAIAGDGRVVICTQSLYAPRTTYLAKKFGLTATIADSDIRIYTSSVGKSRLRETFAATKAVFEGNFAKACRYPLDRYPFTGGDADA